MAFHHVAFAARDMAATHRFYTEACAFEAPPVPRIFRARDFQPAPA